MVEPRFPFTGNIPALTKQSAPREPLSPLARSSSSSKGARRPTAKRLLLPFVLSGGAVAVLPVGAAADCSPFFTPGSGATLSGDARCVIFAPGDGEQLRAGDDSDGPSGTITVTGGTIIDLESGDPNLSTDTDPYLVVGRTAGNTGEATVSGSGSAINLLGEDDGPAIHIGRQGTGNVTVEKGASLTVSDPGAMPGSGVTEGEVLAVGMDGGIGTLTLDDGAASVTSGSGAFLFVGREGGNGTVNVLNGSTVSLTDTDISASGPGTGLVIGRDADSVFGGTGAMSVIDSSVTLHSDQNFSNISVGRDTGTTGELILQESSTVVRVESGTLAAIRVGRDSGSSGTLAVTDGATLQVDAPESVLQLGRDAEATGLVEVTGGGTIQVLGQDGDVTVGAAFADRGRSQGGNGTMVVSGAGSSVETTNEFIVGAPESLGGGTALGRLTVADGGMVAASQLFIGTGGVLDGAGGTIAADLLLDGGIIAPGASPGTLTVAGDFQVLGGLLDIEIGGTTPGSFDIIEVLGNFVGSEPFDVRLNFIDGFVPEVGDSFSFLEVAGDTGNLEELLALSLIDVDFVGLSPMSEFDLVFDGSSLGAVSERAAAIPVPTSLPMLLAGLGILGLARRRRLSPADR